MHFILLILCIIGHLAALPLQERRLDPAALSELTTFFSIPQEADLVQATQQMWLRKAGTERWEMQELSLDQRQFVLNWAVNQGMFKVWAPSQKHYDKAFLLGASTQRMESRLSYLKELWEAGIRFDEIVWLTGARPLDERVDAYLDYCATESQAAEIIWAKADLPMAMRDLPVLFIRAPMLQDGERLRRPGTEETIREWLALNPSPCTALFVSDQPFCVYQYAVIQKVLPSPIDFEVVGRGANPEGHPASAAIVLDTIARTLYQGRAP